MKAIGEEGKPKCANWLNYTAIRETVEEYERMWGSGDDASDLSEFNITRNCMECNMKPNLPSPLSTVSEIAGLFKDPILTKLEQVGMIRKCYKPEEGK